MISEVYWALHPLLQPSRGREPLTSLPTSCSPDPGLAAHWRLAMAVKDYPWVLGKKRSLLRTVPPLNWLYNFGPLPEFL